MKKLIKSLFYFGFITGIIACYIVFDITRVTRVTFIVTGLMQGNVISFPAGDASRKEKMAGGMPYVISKIRELEKKASRANSNFFVLDCGDNFSGTAESYYSQSRVVVDSMNMMGLSAMLLGNREFDYGFEVLKFRVADANFPILAANVRNRETGMPYSEFRDCVLLETFGKKIRIGVLGITPPETLTDCSLKNVSTLSLISEREAIDIFMKKAANEKVDFTIALTQADIEKDIELLDLIVKSGFNMVTALDFKSQLNDIGRLRDTIVVPLRSMARGSEITKVEMVFDGETKKTIECIAEIIPVPAGESEPDAECVKLISEYLRELDAIMNKVIGYARFELKRPFNEETNLGNFITDCMREAASTEVALENAGSFRNDIGAGEITVGALYNAIPFNNDIVSLEISGKTLFDIINTSSARERGLLQISGGSYVYTPDGAGPKKNKIAVTSFLIASKEIELNKKYTLAVNSFLASGQGGYPQLKDCKKIAVINDFREVVQHFISEKKNIEATLENRIVRLSN